MRSLQRAGLGLALAGLWVGSAAPMLAADSGSINAEVDVAAPCIVVDPGTLDFGTLPFSSNDVLPSIGAAGFSYLNCSSGAEIVFARGSDATGGGGAVTWTLDGTPSMPAYCPSAGLNTYVLGFSSSGGTHYLTTTQQQIETVPGNAYGTNGDMGLVMPCVGSDGLGTTMSLQILFTATF
jgi:hypothetical protein